MKILKRTLIIIVPIILILYMVYPCLPWIYTIIYLNKAVFPPSYNKADKYLEANIEELSYVADKLLEMDYDNISVSDSYTSKKEGYSMEVWRKNDPDDESIPIPDEIDVPDELLDHIKVLYEGKVQDITCCHDSDGFYVVFTLWDTMYESRYISYGANPDSEQVIEVRQLSKDNWYYYVHNYEKAKEMYPERFT